MKINIPHMVFSATLLQNKANPIQEAHVECKINFPQLYNNNKNNKRYSFIFGRIKLDMVLIYMRGNSIEKI